MWKRKPAVKSGLCLVTPRIFQFGTKSLASLDMGCWASPLVLDARHNRCVINEIRRPSWTFQCNVVAGICIYYRRAPPVGGAVLSGSRPVYVGLGKYAGTGRRNYRSGPRGGGRQGTARTAERGHQNVAGKRAGRPGGHLG